ncbi:MAG: glycosyltransferase family 4 protein [Nocardioidaceae bacterium]
MKIRFLLYNVYGQAGGVVTVALSLAHALAERHDVEIVTLVRRQTEPANPLPPGVPVRTLLDYRHDAEPPRTRPWARWASQRPSRLMPPSAARYEFNSLYSDLRLARYVASVRDGALIGMQPGVIVAIARLGRASAVRIGQEHRPFRSRPASMRRAALTYYPRLDRLLTLTERDARHYRRSMDGRVGVMPNGTPPYDGPRSNQQNKVVIAAGRLRRSKGYDRLIDAWARVVSRHPDWKLRIFGEGPRRNALQRQITDRGLGDSVRLMGYSPRLGEEMAEGSLFALSSRAEGYPMVLLEAMACGLPVVAFDCRTGPREIITPDRDGVLVPDGDITGFADAISGLIEQDDRRARLGAVALESARQRSQDAIVDRWEKLLLEEHDRRARR